MPLEDADKVIADLRAIPREVRRELTPVLKRAGDAAAGDARAGASWSTRIPGAIRVVVRYGGKRPGVALRVSAKRAPHARPFEGLGRPGTFRHPLPVRKRMDDGQIVEQERWFSQARRPFAWPAISARRDEIQRDVNDIVMSAARRHGFH